MEPNILNDELPVTGNPRIDHWLALAGAIVPVCSALAASLNQKIRDAQAANEEIPEFLLKAASVVNFLAINLDKSRQISKMIREIRAAKKGAKLAAAPAAPAAATAAQPVAEAPAAPAPDVVKPE